MESEIRHIQGRLSTLQGKAFRANQADLAQAIGKINDQLSDLVKNLRGEPAGAGASVPSTTT